MNRKINVLIFGLILALGLISPLNLLAKDSKMFGVDLERSRISREPLSLPVKEVWSTTVADTRHKLPIMGQPVVIEEFNRVFLTAGRSIIALDLNTGRELGKQPIEINEDTFPSASSITYSNNKLFVGTRSSGVFAFPADFTYGYSRLWHFPLTSKVTSSPLVTDGKVIFGSSNTNVYLLDQDTGRSARDTTGNISPIRQDGEVTSSPTLVGDNFYFGVDNNYINGSIRGYNLKGTPTYRFITGAGVPSSIATDGKNLYFSDKVGRFYSLPTRAEEANWINSTLAYAGNTFINNSPALYKDKVYFVVNNFKGTGKAKVLALDKEEGRKKWEAILDTTSIVAPIIWAHNNLLMAGDDEGNIYGFDADTGRPVPWCYDPVTKETLAKIKLPGAICGEFTIAGARLLISSSDGKIRAYGQDGMINLKAVSMTGGVERAQANKEYLGAVRFSINTLEEAVKAPIRIYLDDRLIYEKEMVLPEGQATSIRMEFPWRTPIGIKDSFELKATINENRAAKKISTGETFDEITYQDNSVTMTVPTDTLNLEVLEILAPNSVETGKNYRVKVKVKNHSSGKLKTWVKLYRNQAEISKEEVEINGGQSKEVSFVWKSPGSEGTIVLKGVVNPDRVQREITYEDNKKSKEVRVLAPEISQTGGQLSLTATADTREVKAGYGFSLTAITSTSDYIINYTEPVVDGQGNLRMVPKTRTEPCPGPQKVTATFPNGEAVELEPVNSKTNTHNTWQLPNNPRANGRKHLIPVETPDGQYKVIITAHKAGKKGEFSAIKTIVVNIKGSIYDDFHSRITR